MDKEILKRMVEISDYLKKEYHAERVILFGSCARGDATEDSDVENLNNLWYLQVNKKNNKRWVYVVLPKRRVQDKLRWVRFVIRKNCNHRLHRFLQDFIKLTGIEREFKR